MKFLRPVLISLAAAAALTSCQLIDRIFNGDVIARVGKDVLYEYQVAELLPKDCTPEDSAHIVRQFIDSWATQLLVLRQAEQNLSKDDRNIEKEMEELRRDLLSYRYEMKYVDTHLDTLITDEECETFYKNNDHSLTEDTYLIKCRYVKMPTSSPNLKQVVRFCRSDVEEDLNSLDDICFTSAEKYFRYDDQWIPLSVIARELNESLAFCEEEIVRSNFLNLEKDGYSYLLYVMDKVAPGNQVPFEYCEERIKEIILSRRKQELLSTLERNLLVDAKSSGFLTIYDNL